MEYKKISDLVSETMVDTNTSLDSSFEKICIFTNKALSLKPQY